MGSYDSEAEQLRELNERMQRMDRELARARRMTGLPEQQQPTTLAEIKRQARQKMLADGIQAGSIIRVGPPLVSDYNRAPDRHVDEADVRADEDTSDEQEAGPLGGTDQASGFDLERNTHGPMTGQHRHGIYHEHVHNGDADHSHAALKAGPALGKNY